MQLLQRQRGSIQTGLTALGQVLSHIVQVDEQCMSTAAAAVLPSSKVGQQMVVQECLIPVTCHLLYFDQPAWAGHSRASIALHKLWLLQPMMDG
jgi:hypothetical protein